MTLIPTSSQTVGPFFSIGLAPLCQDTNTEAPLNAFTLAGTLRDGEAQPIPDAVLEFWSGEQFTRAATSEDGSFSVVLSASAASRLVFSDVLIFMRGLLRPVRTRVYFGELEAIKNNSELRPVPLDRIGTLIAHKTHAPNRYSWDVFMQGDSETVFFHF